MFIGHLDVFSYELLRVFFRFLCNCSVRVYMEWVATWHWTSRLCTWFMAHLRPGAGPAARPARERVPLLGSGHALPVGTWEPACEISFFRGGGE